MKFFERVAFDQPVEAADGYGGVTITWQEVASDVPADYLRLRNGEAVMAGRLAGRETIVVTVRSNETTRLIDGTYRMRDNKSGRTYNVKAATRDAKDRRYVEVLVEGGETA